MDKWARGQWRGVFNETSNNEKRMESHGGKLAAREELDRREAARPSPHPAPALTPGNHVEQYVHERHAKRNEKRIKRVRKRLTSKKHKARDDFGRSR